MKVIILAGGFGTRLSEYTDVIPKPMVEINSKPILERIINIFTYYNHTKFYIALGYKAEVINNYFDSSDKNKINYEVLGKKIEINLIDTGLETMTGGRIKRLQEFIKDDSFMMTYGDGVSNINLRNLEDFHNEHKKMISVTAVRPPARFGAIELVGDKVKSFKEKSQLDEGWINGGFFVMKSEIFNYLEDDNTILERDPLENIAKEDELRAYKHDGFWQCMDTKRDREILEKESIKSHDPWQI